MPDTTRRELLGLLGVLGSASCRAPQSPLPAGSGGARTPIKDRLRSIPLRDVRLEGRLGAKIDLCIRNRIMAQDADHLVEPFRHRDEKRCWQTEFWGKWFTSAAAAWRYTQDAPWLEALGQSVAALVETQTPDGYIGNYADGHHLEAWDIWGRKYTLLGLLAYYDITEDPAALGAARRLGDHLLTEVGPGKTDIVKTGNYRGMASSSVLEPVVLLYRHTRDERYLDFAEYIVRQWASRRGPKLIEKALAGVPVAKRFPPPERWWSWENGQKAYEMMSCYEGLLELYRVTRNETYFQAALRAFENIRDTEIMITGSGASQECWYGGKPRQTDAAEHMMETCVTMTWMKFCQNLLRLTGEARFADEIERSAYNALLGAMTPDGASFAKYSPLEGVRQLGPPQCDMNLNCCTANGPRGMMLLPEVAVMTGAEGPVVNLYCDGAALVTLASGNRVRIRQQTGYPASGAIVLTIKPEKPERFPLRLRIPSWSEETSLTVNGEPVQPVEAGRYARIERAWKAGDRVTLRLDLQARAVASPDGSHSHTAIVRGPIVLARDRRLGEGDVDGVVSVVATDAGYVEMEPVEADAWMAFRAPLNTNGHLTLCDYASAGNTWDERSRFRVWLPQR